MFHPLTNGRKKGGKRLLAHPFCVSVHDRIPKWWFQQNIHFLPRSFRKSSNLTILFPNGWLNHIDMGISKNSGTPKMDGLLKWMIWGYHYFRKHSYRIRWNYAIGTIQIGKYAAGNTQLTRVPNGRAVALPPVAATERFRGGNMAMANPTIWRMYPPWN